MNRAMTKAKQSLEKAGIKVVDWEPYKSLEMLEIIVSNESSGKVTN